ncbi:DMT family transporter [Caldimonas brevitalea]|uniref:DMT family transporter n=1 Tax=Caldimonas brevitalea TaxID=413882 RepID=UPI0009F8B76E|nr:DMT family transporter [Caldimonas brevitalea]
MSQSTSVGNASENRWASYFCLALAMTLTGVYVSVCKPLGAALPVFLLAWLRFCMAAVAVLPWLRTATDTPPLSPKSRWLLFLQSFFGNFLFTICMVYGLRLTSAVSAGVILACIPAAVALFSRVFLREHVSLRIWVSIGLAAGGIALLSMAQVSGGNKAGDPASREEVWLGNFLVLMTVFCEAAYVVIGKKLTEDISPKRVAALINLWGLTLFTLPGLYEAIGFDFSLITPRIWSLLVFYAMSASVICVWLWMTGLRHVPAAQSGVFTVLFPVGTVLSGILFLDERLSGLHLAAFALATTGLLLATTRSVRFFRADDQRGRAKSGVM